MKILIGSNGGLTGVYLAKNLSQCKQIELYGADSSETSVGKFFVKKQFVLPNATSANFVDELTALINREKIDIYLPTHSKETKVIAQNEEIIRSSCDAAFLISPYETYVALEDKTQATMNLEKNGIPVPGIISSPNENDYPIFMKNNVGSGSKGTALVENGMLYEAFKNTYKDASFYEYIKGKEYTVDCLFDGDGVLQCYNQRVREKSVGGAVSVSSTDNHFDILPWIKKISQTWKFCGCVNFQYILKDDIPYFIDINLRYPAGGLALTVEAGIDIPRLLVNMLSDKEKLPVAYEADGKHPKLDKNIRMYKYYEEIFEEI